MQSYCEFYREDHTIQWLTEKDVIREDHTIQWLTVKDVIREDQTIQWLTEKGQNDKQWCTKHYTEN
jgi:hypothetical protein